MSALTSRCASPVRFEFERMDECGARVATGRATFASGD